MDSFDSQKQMLQTLIIIFKVDYGKMIGNNGIKEWKKSILIQYLFQYILYINIKYQWSWLKENIILIYICWKFEYLTHTFLLLMRVGLGSILTVFLTIYCYTWMFMTRRAMMLSLHKFLCVEVLRNTTGHIGFVFTRGLV